MRNIEVYDFIVNLVAKVRQEYKDFPRLFTWSLDTIFDKLLVEAKRQLLGPSDTEQRNHKIHPDEELPSAWEIRRGEG